MMESYGEPSAARVGSVGPVPCHRLHELWRGVGAAGPANKQPPRVDRAPKQESPGSLPPPKPDEPVARQRGLSGATAPANRTRSPRPSALRTQCARPLPAARRGFASKPPGKSHHARPHAFLAALRRAEERRLGRRVGSRSSPVEGLRTPVGEPSTRAEGLRTRVGEFSMRAEEFSMRAGEFRTRVGEPNSKIVPLIFDAGFLSSPPERQKSSILNQNRRVKGWQLLQNANAEGACLRKQGEGGAWGQAGGPPPARGLAPPPPPPVGTGGGAF